jgi:hypothetical protein
LFYGIAHREISCALGNSQPRADVARTENKAMALALAKFDPQGRAFAVDLGDP